MNFSNQCKHFAEPSVLLDKSPVKVVTESKFLPVFDWTLSYSSHVNYLKTYCLRALDILKVVGHTDWGADQKTLLGLYWALVWSKLVYGCIVYGAASNNILKTLDPIHHQILHIALGVCCTCPVTSLYAKSTRIVFEKQMHETLCKLCLKTKSLSR